MENRDRQDPYEFFSRAELKQEAIEILSQVPQDKLYEERAGFRENRDRRLGSDHFRILYRRFEQILGKVEITDHFRKLLIGDFLMTYATGGEIDFLRRAVIGDEQTDGIFDPRIAYETELGFLLGLQDNLSQAHEQTLPKAELAPLSEAMEKGLKSLDEWSKAFRVLHPDSLG